MQTGIELKGELVASHICQVGSSYAALLLS